MPDLGWPELVIILAVLLLLFGAKKLPDIARSTGRSLRIFKAETKGLIHDDDDKSADAAKPAAPQAIAASDERAGTQVKSDAAVPASEPVER